MAPTPRDAHKKSVLEETPDSALQNPQVSFDETRFNDVLQDKGQDLLLEKAMRCACIDVATGNGNTNCKNCGGSSWFFISKKKTRGVIQSINRKTTYSNWNEEDRGTINATFRAVDRFGFMDRLTLTNVTSIFSQLLKFKDYNSKFFAYTAYMPLLVTDCYLYQGDEQPLIPLLLQTDYTIEENKIVLDNRYKNLGDDITVSIRYTHFPQYHIIDIPREVSVNKGRNCTEEEYLKQFPINAICRKSHYLFEAPNAIGESLYDNTNYSNLTEQQLLESLSPDTLLFHIVRSNAAQIVEALNTEGNADKIAEIIDLLD